MSNDDIGTTAAVITSLSDRVQMCRATYMYMYEQNTTEYIKQQYIACNRSMYYSLNSLQNSYVHENIFMYTHSATVQYDKSHQLSNSSMVRGLSRDPEGLVEEEDDKREKGKYEK